MCIPFTQCWSDHQRTPRQRNCKFPLARMLHHRQRCYNTESRSKGRLYSRSLKFWYSCRCYMTSGILYFLLNEILRVIRRDCWNCRWSYEDCIIYFFYCIPVLCKQQQRLRTCRTNYIQFGFEAGSLGQVGWVIDWWPEYCQHHHEFRKSVFKFHNV